MLAFLPNFGAMEIFVIFMVILLFFGAKRLPDLFRSFGKSLKEFKKATSEIEDDFREAMNDEEKPKQAAEQRTSGQAESDVGTAASKKTAAHAETEEIASTKPEPQTDSSKK